MIQRIQSLFLLAAGGLSFALLGVPFAATSETVGASALFSDAQYSVYDSPALLAFYLLGGLLALVSIFLYRKRTLQIRVGIFSFIAILIGMVLTAILFMQDAIIEHSVQPNDRAGIFLPFLSLIALLLAQRYIRKDENLVRSMDRLR
jgi:peptidoglycan/LPS O-acetylase OafA/YrhL